jgi:hypothetical protein
MAWSIGSITLPSGPKDIADDSDCETDSLPLDGAESIVFATAPGMRIVSWSGSLFDSSSPTKADLESDYCAALRGFQGTSQSVVSPSGAYTGTWFIKKVTLSEQAEGTLARISYTIIMWQGSFTEVL